MSVTQDLRAELDAANNKCIALQHELSIAEATIQRLSAASSDADTQQLIRELIARVHQAPDNGPSAETSASSTGAPAGMWTPTPPGAEGEPFKPGEPVMVRDNDHGIWRRRYYAAFKKGAHYAWKSGITPWASDSDSSGTHWEQVRRPTTDELAMRKLITD